MNAVALLNVLAFHHGRDRGISAEQLEKVTGVPQRRLRVLISELREEGLAICGKPETGYFMATSADELDESCQFLRHRAMRSLQLEARMRKISLPELVGQLKLNQA